MLTRGSELWHLRQNSVPTKYFRPFLNFSESGSCSKSPTLIRKHVSNIIIFTTICIMYDYIYVNINIFDLMKLNWPVLIRRFDLGVARDHSRTRNKFENVNFVFFGQLKGQRQKNNMKLTSSSMSSIWLTLAIPSSTEVSFSPIICFFFHFEVQRSCQTI